MRRFILAILLLIPLTACDEENDVSFQKTLRHPNGLAVGVPEGFAAAETEDGFAMTEAGDLRSPGTIAVRLTDDMPDLAGANDRTVAGARVRYSVEELAGGSGGAEYRLTAAAPWRGRAVVLQARSQSEQGEPDFARAWAVLEHALAK